FKKPASPKLTIVPVSTEEPMGKSKRVKRRTKKSTKAPTRGVVIKETPEMSLSEKKEKKSMRDFHKTHPSGSSIVTKTAQNDAKIKPSITNEGTGVKPGVPDVTKEESSKNNENELDSEYETDERKSGSESNHEENNKDEDDEEKVKDEFVKTPSNDSDDENKTKITDKAKGDEDEKMDYTTNQLYNDVDIRLNKPIDTDKGKEVAELKKDPLNIQVTTLVDDHLDARLGAIRDEFMNFLLASLTARITEQMVKESLEDAVLAKESSQPQSLYEATATLTEFELKKILIEKIDKSESYLAAPEHKECYEGLKNHMILIKLSSLLMSEELEFEVADSDMPQDQEENPGPVFRLFKGTHTNYAELEYDFEECYKALSEKLDWENP
nr:hypothetical protein [Tanacetum cinerariifolium]